MDDAKPIDYRAVAERLRDAAQAAFSNEARAQFLVFATIYDNLARADEAIGRSRNLLPLPSATGPRPVSHLLDARWRHWRRSATRRN